MCAGSVVVRANLERILRWIRLSMSLHREWGGCDGSGLKFMRKFNSVLWIYAVVSLLRCRLVMLFSLVMMFFFVISLFGVVSPFMLRWVPKCLLYGVVTSVSSPVGFVCISTLIYVSSGVCVRKLHAKLLNFGRVVPGGALWM